MSQLTRIAAALLVLFALAATPATAQDSASYVVLASTDPQFVVGELVDDGDTLAVPSGASLTLIDALGKIKVVEGPFLGRLRSDTGDESEPSFLTDLANIIALTDGAEPTLGMGRGSTPAPEVSPWLVAFGRPMPGDLCVSPVGQLVFYRADDQPAPVSLRFGAADGGAEAIVQWAAGDVLAHWPGALPPVDGAAYFIDDGAAPRPPEFTIHLAPAAFDSDAHAAVWLARSGCQPQAQAMIRRLALGG